MAHHKLKEICNTFVLNLPDAVGIAYIELDCGCINLSGVSVTGEPVGGLQTLYGIAEGGTEEAPICMRCYQEKSLSLDRVTHRGLIWPGDREEKPAEALRAFIGQTVFGPEYSEPPEDED